MRAEIERVIATFHPGSPDRDLWGSLKVWNPHGTGWKLMERRFDSPAGPEYRNLLEITEAEAKKILKDHWWIGDWHQLVRK